MEESVKDYPLHPLLPSSSSRRMSRRGRTHEDGCGPGTTVTILHVPMVTVCETQLGFLGGGNVDFWEVDGCHPRCLRSLFPFLYRVNLKEHSFPEVSFRLLRFPTVVVVTVGRRGVVEELDCQFSSLRTNTLDLTDEPVRSTYIDILDILPVMRRRQRGRYSTSIIILN